MKKTGIIALVLLYTLAVVGINLSVHYCGERVDSVSLGTKESKCCCGTDKDDDCCTTVTVKAKVDDTHTPGNKQKINPPIAVPIHTDSAITPVIPSSRQPKFDLETVNPPPQGLPLYLSNSNFRI